MRSMISITVLIGLTVSGAAGAQGGHPGHGTGQESEGRTARPRSAAAQARYPQPVRVGELAGRELLDNSPRQRVLGRVAAVTRRGDGQVFLLVHQGGLLGLGTRLVTLPAAATALLGPFLVLMDLEPEVFAALPDVGPAHSEALSAEETVQIGLTRN